MGDCPEFFSDSRNGLRYCACQEISDTVILANLVVIKCFSILRTKILAPEMQRNELSNI